MTEIEQSKELLAELTTLLRDYDELSDMNKDTSAAENEVRNRLAELKEYGRELIENSLDIPVILDGALLIYEKSVKKRSKGDSFYMEKEVYRLDVEEESLMNSIRFVNSKKDLPLEKIPSIISSLKRVTVTSYGYRLSPAASTEDENIYTGTVFNNSNYSRRSYDLLEKLMLKIKDDYITRVNSSYSTIDYVVQPIDNRWLIINLKNGATDVLDEEEGIICRAAFDVQDCFDEDNILKNNRTTDEHIEKLQVVVINYLEKRKNVKL